MEILFLSTQAKQNFFSLNFLRELYYKHSETIFVNIILRFDTKSMIDKGKIAKFDFVNI